MNLLLLIGILIKRGFPLNLLLLIGILINCSYTCLNRFWKPLPNVIAIPILLLGIGLMIAGAFLTRAA